MKIYIVMSTNENESEYYIKSAFRAYANALVEQARLEFELSENSFIGEDGEEYNSWQVWIEEVELQDESAKEYTNYETKKVTEEILESGDLYGDAIRHKEDNGDFTEDTARELFEHHSCLYRSIENVDWKEVAEELNSENH